MQYPSIPILRAILSKVCSDQHSWPSGGNTLCVRYKLRPRLNILAGWINPKCGWPYGRPDMEWQPYSSAHRNEHSHFYITYVSSVHAGVRRIEQCETVGIKKGQPLMIILYPAYLATYLHISQSSNSISIGLQLYYTLYSKSELITVLAFPSMCYLFLLIRLSRILHSLMEQNPSVQFCSVLFCLVRKLEWLCLFANSSGWGHQTQLKGGSSPSLGL